MTKTSFLFYSLGLALCAISCSKDENQPAGKLPLNTLQVEAYNKAFPVDITKTQLVVTKGRNGFGNTVTLTATSSNSQEELSVSAETERPTESVEAARVYNNPDPVYGNVVASYQHVVGNNALRSYSTFCSCNYRFTMEIQSVNTKEQTMSGTFSGNVCKGPDCTIIKITNGRFHLPYTIAP